MKGSVNAISDERFQMNWRNFKGNRKVMATRIAGGLRKAPEKAAENQSQKQDGLSISLIPVV